MAFRARLSPDRDVVHVSSVFYFSGGHTFSYHSSFGFADKLLEILILHRILNLSSYQFRFSK